MIVIGAGEIAAGMSEQGEMLERVAERAPADGPIHHTLEEYAGNMGVDFAALADLASHRLREDDQVHDVATLVLVTAVAAKYFLLGVVLGRDHRP